MGFAPTAGMVWVDVFLYRCVALYEAYCLTCYCVETVVSRNAGIGRTFMFLHYSFASIEFCTYGATMWVDVPGYRRVASTRHIDYSVIEY
jgi:hypothetical protein